MEHLAAPLRPDAFVVPAAGHPSVLLPTIKQILRIQSGRVEQVALEIAYADHSGRWKPFFQYPSRMGADGAEALNENRELLGAGHFQPAELVQHGQPRQDVEQPLQGDDHAARCRAQLVDAVAAHRRRLGNGAVQAVFGGDGLHVRVAGADIRPRNVQVAVAPDQARKTADHFPVLLRRTARVGDDAGLAPAEGQVGGGVLEGHPAGEVVDVGRGDLGQHADAAHGRRPHRQVVHHQVAADLEGRGLVPHQGHELGPERVADDSHAAEQVLIAVPQHQMAPPLFAPGALAQDRIGNVFVQVCLQPVGDHGRDLPG